VPRTIAEDWWIVRTLGQQRYLLLSLLALLILFPIVAREGPDRFLWYTLMTLIVITGPISLASSRLAMLTGIFASLFFGHLGILIFGQHLGFRNHEVSSDTILAAVNAYLCMGLTFAFAYFSVNLALPDSFSGAFMDSPLRDQVEGFIYFSFVTMTTLGYGDISPVTPTAAVLAYMQAVAGQLYMAVTIARVVGMYVAHRAGQNAP
jgi:hypothetical protein